MAEDILRAEPEICAVICGWLTHAANVWEEIAKRKAAVKPQPPKQVTGYLKRYRAMVTSANKGAILDDSNL